MYCPSPELMRSKSAMVMPWSVNAHPMCHAWCPCPPMGVTAGPLTAQVGAPLSIAAFVSDDGKGAMSIAGGRGTAASVTLAWFKHQGPGAVTFQPATGRAASAGAQVTTQATFAVAGDYIIRLRANDSTVAGAGHAQCCWTNGFLKVTVK